MDERFFSQPETDIPLQEGLPLPETPREIDSENQSLLSHFFTFLKERIGTVRPEKIAQAIALVLATATSIEADPGRVRPKNEKKVEIKESQKHENREHEERMQRVQEWLTTLRAARDLGYSIRITSGVCLSQRARTEDYERVRILDALSHQKEKIGTFGSPDPLAQLQYRYPDLTRIPPDLAKSMEVEVTPFILDLKREGNDLVMVVENWLADDPESPIVRGQFHDAPRDYKDLPRDIAEWGSIPKAIEAMANLSNDPSQQAIFAKALEERLNSVPSKELQAPILSSSMFKEFSRTEKEKRLLAEFFFKWTVDIEVSPPGAPIDRIKVLGRQDLILPVMHSLNERTVEQNEYAPIFIDGHVQSLMLEQDIKDARPFPKGSPYTAEGEPIIESWEDAQGNRYLKVIILAYSGDKINKPDDDYDTTERTPVLRKIEITPPLAIGTASGPLVLNLGRYGGEVPAFLVRKQLRREGEIGAYSLYSNANDGNEFAAVFPKEKMQAFTDGISAAEKFFGYDAGFVVHNIYLPNTEEVNAKSGGETVILFDEMVKVEGAAGLMLTGRHEAAHSIDTLTRCSDDGRWQEFFAELVVEEGPEKVEKNDNGTGGLLIEIRIGFLSHLAEGKFFADQEVRSQHGHPWSNEKEFFSSVINSLQHPDWEKSLRVAMGNSPSFLECYARTIDILTSIITEHMRIPDNAPICSRLAEIREHLNNIQKEQGEK